MHAQGADTLDFVLRGAPYTLHPSPYITPHILHHMSHPTPYTLRPTSFNLYPTPCLKPGTLNGPVRAARSSRAHTIRNRPSPQDHHRALGIALL